jgi:hypothetical protein
MPRKADGADMRGVGVITFSVKNFEKFQHYKDRSPPWIKLYNELLDDYAFGTLPDATKFHLVAIWLLASRSENKIPYDPRWVAQRINAGSAVDLDVLAASGFIVVNQELQGAEHDASTPPAKSLSREREETEGEAETETDSRAVAVAPPPRSACRFEEFWQAYPRRDGANPRPPAEKKFKALVKSGVDPQMMIDAIRKLAAEEGAKGNIGTRFIPQATRWLNERRWSDHAAVAFLVADRDPAVLVEDAVKMWVRLGRWSRFAGPEPGMLGCRASAELLAKYGLDPHGRKIDRSGEAA